MVKEPRPIYGSRPDTGSPTRRPWLSAGGDTGATLAFMVRVALGTIIAVAVARAMGVAI